MSKIFGGSKQKSQSTSSSQQASQSSNQAFPWLQQNFGQGAAQSFNQGTSALNALLGQGFDGYKDNIAYDFQQDQGRGSILGNLAGRGALQSGAALKGLTQYSNNLASTTYDNYLNKLLQQAQLGAGAGQLIGGAGGVSQSIGTSTAQSTSSGKQSGGLGGFLGGILGSVAGGL